MLIKVLLSSYNGEKYIEEQLDSILAQKCSADIEILVRDDGSKDSTDNILDRYQEKGLLKWYKGENLRCARSFWDLMLNSGDADYYAFCDQDDFWMNDKLESAINMLGREDNNIPLLYSGNFIAVDKELKAIKKVDKGMKNTGFGNSLIKSLSPGCTFVFNKKACEIMRMYTGELDIHDWVAHKIVAAFGKVVYDPEPHMLYRQHGNNVIGVAKNNCKLFFARVKRFLNGTSTGVRSKMAQNLLDNFGNMLSEEKLTVLKHLTDYKKSFKDKLTLLKDKHFDLGSPIANFQFAILVLLNKV